MVNVVVELRTRSKFEDFENAERRGYFDTTIPGQIERKHALARARVTCRMRRTNETGVAFEDPLLWNRKATTRIGLNPGHKDLEIRRRSSSPSFLIKQLRYRIVRREFNIQSRVSLNNFPTYRGEGIIESARFTNG